MHDDPLHSALFTDLYELTMAEAYDAEAMNKQAVFELFFRKLPADRNFCISAGIDDLLAYLESLHFREDDISYLKGRMLFSDRFLERIRKLQFTGDVYAVPEGTVVFPNEPFVQVVAPVIEAQLIETFAINQLHMQTVLASKAARIVTAAAGRTVVDFGSRRAHGVDAALKAARASYLVGAAGTSLVLAGKQYGIPIFGTMAHSYIQAHDDEAVAFEAFARLFPETTLLVDTYDTIQGIRKAIGLVRKLGDRTRVRAVRLDSGDIGTLARQSRQLLDEAGLPHVQIFVSSELDERRIAELLAGGAPIDGFGVGTRMVVSDDAPHMDMVYKLVEYNGHGRIKLSPGKLLYPGRKQIFRRYQDGRMIGDIVGRHDENLAGTRLLQPVMVNGRRMDAGRVNLDQARANAKREIAALPDAVRSLDRADPPYPVAVSDQLRRDLNDLRTKRERS